jgi:hypothetical protein
MFPVAHPDLMGQLAIERVEGLRAAAARFRLGRPFPARWRPARFVEPRADLSRVVPAHTRPGASGADADRAA